MVTRQELEGQWDEVQGQVKERWGQVTDDDLQQARGSADQLVGVIQQKTGESRRAIEDFLQKAVDGGAATVKKVTDTAREYVEQGSDAARQQYEQASQKMRASYAEAEAMVQKRPVESVAVAFGAGIITGVVLGLVMKTR